MLAYLRKNPLGNSALVAILAYWVVWSFFGYWFFSFPPSLFIFFAIVAFLVFILYRYLSKESLSGESNQYNYRPRERIVLGLIGFMAILTHYLGFTEAIHKSYSDWAALVVLFWICIVGTRDWNIWEKLIWLVCITGLFVLIGL